MFFYIVFHVIKNSSQLENTEVFFLCTKNDGLPHPRVPIVCSESVLGYQHSDP